MPLNKVNYVNYVTKIRGENLNDIQDNIILHDKLISDLQNKEDNVSYIDYTVGSRYEGNNGLMKHRVIPSISGIGTWDAANGLISHTRTSPFPQPKGTKGKIVSSSGSAINIPEIFAYNNISDECNESMIIKRYSDPIVLNYDWFVGYDKLTDYDTGNGWRIKFEIPISQLKGKPATVLPNRAANLIQPGFALKSEDVVSTTTRYGSVHLISFSYDGTSDYAKIMIITHKVGGAGALKKALEVSQFTFRYELSEPKYKYNVDKIYINNGDIINFELEDGYNNYKSITLQTPENIPAAIEGIRPITANINDLNYRVENIEYSSEVNKIGEGDGSTDDTEAIQLAINQMKNINPNYVKEVVLPAGVYRISSPLKMNIENLTLRGEGEVILWATEGNYEPIIRVMKGGCKIENIKIYLAKTEDDSRYTLKNNGISRGYLKSYKETMNSEDIRYGNGHYSGIYVDVGQQFGDGEGLYGFYNITIKDVIIQGAYRYSTKYIEKSYGIYFSKGGFCYFNNIDNCHFNGVMCGMHINQGCEPCDIKCTFDIGDNIYNISGASGNAETFQRKHCDDVIGCRYGVICNSNHNTIHINGQLVGEDSMNPYYYDSDGYEMTLDRSTATVAGKQAYQYSNGEYIALEGQTTVGFPDSIKLEWKKVSDTAILVNGTGNDISGMIYDRQRSEFGSIYLTSKSKYNKFEIRAGYMDYGKPLTSFGRNIYIPTGVDSNGSYTKWTRINFINSVINYKDCGLININQSVNLANQENVYGSAVINSIDKYGISLSFPRNIDKTDDAAAYVDKIGSVSCYYTEDDGTETLITEYWKGDPSDGVTTTDISSIFRPNNTLDYGIYTGITFKEIPTDRNPIIMEIDFGRDLKSISIGDIRFNRYIASSIDICYYIKSGSEYVWTSYYNMTHENSHGEYIFNTYNLNGTHTAIGNIRKMRIKLGNAHQPIFINGVSLNDNIYNYKYSAGDTYNPNGYVGIGKIFIGDYNSGGTAYLPLGGGKVYGDIEPESIILKSTDSNKRFRISINDNGEITSQEI